MNIPIEKQKGFIEEFEKIRPVYSEFAKLLEQILQKAVDQFGYLALVQARAKKVVSFSNKIIMKDKYRNPLTDMTDLCGARVILHFQSHVARVCEFIKDNFEIDEANSLDLKSKLKVNEFGYRSVHYIVTPKKDTILGVPVDDKFKTLKAEVQVRTLAEHVWADISHDRIYKTDLIIPEEWKREAARLAAILEDADRQFADMSQSIDSVSNVYELQYKTERAGNDIQKLKTLTEIQKKEPSEGVKNVLNLVSVYNAMNMPEEAGMVLSEWIDITSGKPSLQTRLQLEMVLMNLTTHCSDIHSTDYNKAIKLAEKYLKELYTQQKEKQVPTASEMSFLFYRYGRILQNNSEKSDESRDSINRALELMPENPFCITALAESLILRNIDMAHHSISLFRNTLEKTIPDLEKLISLGIDEIPAWFAVGNCHFFLGNRRECMNAYSRAVAIILDTRYTANRCVIDSEISRTSRFKSFDKQLAEQISLYLNLAMSVSDRTNDKENYRSSISEFRIRQEPVKSPVIILAGGASLMDESKNNYYKIYIEELMHDFKGTIISGGTTAGIPGLAGRVKTELGKKGVLGFELLAWLPETLPPDAIKSEDYDHFYYTDSGSFTPLDILNCWADIILSGINLSQVILVGIDGGDMATMEYRIALSLGAKVCLVAYSGRAVSDFVHEKPWDDHRNLIHVPNDPYTIWALVNQSAETTLTAQETEKLAPLVHEFYRQQRLKSLKPTETDINKYKVVMDWSKLDPALQHSNIHQVAFYQHILRRVNLGIRKVEKPVLFNIKDNLSADDYNLLAKLEHARWNAERLLEGWKYGTEKDLSKKINPYIVAWDKLGEEIKVYDFEPVNNIPLMLEKIGYEVFAV
jgi:ppGpp synthetase/RelA/SpoT-type nucleotidyltranferase